ncbi:MAG: aspartate carbamoyltransferase catalytic subunit, partial [Verrucomicrobia bacterium]|nr:aspartate carbamoyltransferase catalytic subunit [Verrucomicrobiota bacterium]
MTWQRKDLLSLRELSAEEIGKVLSTATVFKEILGRPIKKVPALQGRTVVNLFVEPSTRTRISFELAAVRLSADVVSLDRESSSIRKGETLKDTARNLEALQAGTIVIRHRSAGAAHFLAERLKASVINAGDGSHEHPTQGLLDAFTIQERMGKIAGVRVLIVGDIIHSRVARSNLWALTKLGAKVKLVGPSTLLPKEFAELGVEVSHDLEGALEEADVINLLRIQHERQVHSRVPSIGEYAALFG